MISAISPARPWPTLRADPGRTRPKQFIFRSPLLCLNICFKSWLDIDSNFGSRTSYILIPQLIYVLRSILHLLLNKFLRPIFGVNVTNDGCGSLHGQHFWCFITTSAMLDFVCSKANSSTCFSQILSSMQTILHSEDSAESLQKLRC